MSDYTAQERSTLIVATLTSFMGPFMISAVNVALPAIQAEFKVDAVRLSWITTAFLLSVAVFLVPVGKIADIHGRKKMFTAGLALFTLGALLAGFAGTVNLLIFFRVLQGIGSAMFLTTGMAIVTSVFPPNKRGRAIGIYVAAVYIGLSAGPFVGGIFTQQIGWRSIFFLAVPLGVGSVAITLRYLKGEWADARGEKLDTWGSLLYSLSIMALVYGATILPARSALVLLAAGFLCLLAFVWREASISFPVFEIRLFVENRLFTFSSFAALIHYAATYAVTFLLSLYLQYIQGLSPQQAGLILIVQPITMAVFSPLAGKWSDRIEPRKIASAGMATTVFGLLLLIFLSADTGRLYVIGNLLVLGFGFALFSSPNMNAIMGSVEKRYFGIASGSVATMRLLGQMSSMAAATVVFSIFIGRQEISPPVYDLFLRSIRILFSISALLCTVGIGFSLFRGELRRIETVRR